MRFKISTRRIWPVIGIVVLLALCVLALSLRGVRSRVRMLVDTCRAVLDSSSVEASGDLTNVIFLHHSTGRNLIVQGEVQERLTEAGFQFWDHDYNDKGLTRPDGERTGYSYSIPDDNTDPDGFARIFSQRLYSKPLNAFSGLMQHDVIVFESRFPVSHINDDAQLERYQEYYLQMRQVMGQHPDHIFIVVTPPPLSPAFTDADVAVRARDLLIGSGPTSFWLGIPMSLPLISLICWPKGIPPFLTLTCYAWFTVRERTRIPTKLVNQTIDPLFVDFIVEMVEMSVPSQSG